MSNIANIAHKATVTGLVGLGFWGLWLTGAVWKSRHGEGAIPNMPPQLAAGQQHPMHAGQKDKEHLV